MTEDYIKNALNEIAKGFHEVLIQVEKCNKDESKDASVDMICDIELLLAKHFSDKPDWYKPQTMQTVVSFYFGKLIYWVKSLGKTDKEIKEFIDMIIRNAKSTANNLKTHEKNTQHG